MSTVATAPSPDEVALPKPACTTQLAWLLAFAFALATAPFTASLTATPSPEALAAALFGPGPLTIVSHLVPSTFVLVTFIVLERHDSESPPAFARPIDSADSITTATIVATPLVICWKPPLSSANLHRR